MAVYQAYEYHVTDHEITQTGRIETYQAGSRGEAVQSCLYAHRISDGRARILGSGYTVQAGRYCYAVME